MPSAVGPFRPIILISAFSASSLEDSSGREDSGWLADTSVSEDSGAEEVAAPHPAKGRASISTARNKDNAFVIFFMIFFSFLFYHIKGASPFSQSLRFRLPPVQKALRVQNVQLRTIPPDISQLAEMVQRPVHRSAADAKLPGKTGGRTGDGKAFAPAHTLIVQV